MRLRLRGKQPDMHSVIALPTFLAIDRSTPRRRRPSTRRDSLKETTADGLDLDLDLDLERPS